MSSDTADIPSAFAAHLRRVNARRVEAASRYLVLVMALLLAANLLIPAVRIWNQAEAQVVAILYFAGLAAALRLGRGDRWPLTLPPLLFGGATMLVGLVFASNLVPRFGVNPAYATLLFVTCLGPIWPRRLLAAVLLLAQTAHLVWIWAGGHSQEFKLGMTFAAMATLIFGWLVAAMQYRSERLAFDSETAIRRQKDGLAAAIARVNLLLEERRELVAVAAHDLQSPLAGIRLLLRALEEEPEKNHARELREIARTCGEMHELVTRLIEAHAAETAEERPGVIDINPIIRAGIAAFLPAAEEKDIRLRDETASVFAVAEPQGLARAFGNLLSNAIKYAPPASEVRVSVEREASWMRVAVLDEGPGIPPGEEDRLFRKFSKLSTHPSGVEPATGLGLYIVRQLVQRMGGEAGWERRIPNGSIFFLRLRAGD